MTTFVNDLDELMSRDPADLSTQDIDKIIAYQRQHRANLEAGIKTKKPSGPKRDLSEILDILPKTQPAATDSFKRRF